MNSEQSRCTIFVHGSAVTLLPVQIFLVINDEYKNFKHLNHGKKESVRITRVPGPDITNQSNDKLSVDC